MTVANQDPAKANNVSDATSSEPLATRGGFSYYVSDEQLARFAQSTIEQRLEWLESMQQWSWDNASDEVRARWRELRRGGRL